MDIDRRFVHGDGLLDRTGRKYRVDGHVATGLNGEIFLQELAEARRLTNDERYATISRFKSVQSLGSPKNLALAETTFFAGLRMAGVPEE